MSNYKFRGVLAPFHAIRKNNRITVENEYVRCVHDMRNGGEMTEAFITNGSGKNLFVKPQCTIVGIIENGGYHCYASDAAAAEDFSLTENHGNPVLEFVSRPADADGKTLDGLIVRHRVEYTPQGEALHRVTLSAARRIACWVYSMAAGISLFLCSWIFARAIRGMTPPCRSRAMRR